MSTIKQEIRSLNDAIANLNLNNIENFLQKHESNLKVFSEAKTREFQERQKALIHSINASINAFIDDIITEAFDENEHKNLISRVETFINTPGLKHLAENIFLNMNYQEIQACGRLNVSFQIFADQLMENPSFLLKSIILGGMSKKNETDWTEIIQKTKGTKFEEIVLLYLKSKTYIQSFDFDVPSIIKKVMDGNTTYIHYIHEIVYPILAPLTDNPNAPNINGVTPIQVAAQNGFTEIVNFLSSLTNNLNASNN